MTSEPIEFKQVGLTAREWSIAEAHAKAAGLNRSQWFGTVVLSQEHEPGKVKYYMARRRGRGRNWHKKGEQ